MRGSPRPERAWRAGTVEGHRTFGLLPDCLPARLSGTLAEVEAVVLVALRGIAAAWLHAQPKPLGFAPRRRGAIPPRPTPCGAGPAGLPGIGSAAQANRLHDPEHPPMTDPQTDLQHGIALIHARPYQPQGQGKIERCFKTVRTQLLTRLTN
jgi:hypothetical protein